MSQKTATVGDLPRKSAVTDEYRVVRQTESGHELRVLESIRGIERERWNAVVERSSRGSVFHRYEWLEAIEVGIGSTPRHLVVTKDGNVIGLFPNFVVGIGETPFRRLVSSHPGFGGPVLTTDVKTSLSLATEAIPTLCTGRTVAHEIRVCDPNYLRYNAHLESAGYRPTRMGGRFVLDLTDGYEEVLAGMSKSRRKDIRRGREGDYEIVEEELTGERLERFYRVYERHVDRLGGERLAFEFFEHLLTMESRVLLLTLRVDGEYAGGFLELLDEEQSAVHGFVAAVPPEYFEHHASELLYDYVLRWAIENGYERYDFGGSGANFESGVFRYKEGFGGDLVPNVYWERGCSPLWKPIEAGRSFYLRHLA
ncbi:lipid II:glycine glycyltransferase FemX [Natrononativus amylolyticus]|uniref:lipid II:glycine glycyltransferase FemX n=1 Tax=Natrononativus amylolyticus TaxID=2963434 RepID=UPI0020CCBD33|nr:GNAT family N-acetyltransferase [Natrononativus amylolyticus]